MKRIVSLMTAILGIGGCSDHAQGGATASGTGGSDGAAASGGVGGAGGSSSPGGGGSSNPNECALQGEFHADTQATLPVATCNSLPAYSTVYNITIAGTAITLEQTGEQVPMSGTIDAQCQATVVLTTPGYREFRLTFDPAAMTGTGSFVTANLSDCRSTYNFSMTLAPGHQ
jgi:hypothetical protein